MLPLVNTSPSLSPHNIAQVIVNKVVAPNRHKEHRPPEQSVFKLLHLLDTWIPYRATKIARIKHHDEE
jgi:hypothetical protein